MAFDLENTELQTRYRIQDRESTGSAPFNHLGQADLQAAIQAALIDYSRDFPREVLTEFVGTDDNYYPLSTAAPSWSEGFSAIRWINYPAAVVADNDYPVLLDPETDWSIEEVLAGSPTPVRTLYLWLPRHTPGTDETIRLAYTTPQTLNGLLGATATTIYTAHETPFYDLCAYRALIFVATRLAQ